MNNKQRTFNGFTLIELAVAIGILAMVFSFASVIFRVSISSQRTAIANAEIMQKLRAITDQLNADFKSMAYEYDGCIAFNTDTLTNINSDCISFFTSGNFQSTEQYSGNTIAGNVACIFYGQPDPNSYKTLPKPREKVLLRRQTILTASDTPGGSANGEFYRKSLSEWKANPPFTDAKDWVKRPLINPDDLKEFLAMYMTEGVDNFTIEYARNDPAGGIKWTRSTQQGPQSVNTNAFKFSFRLYDSRGIIPNGQTFTHIVYLGR